jgi:tRNA-dihydrouridine synthase A
MSSASHQAQPVQRKIAIAPMMKYTDTHFRFFMRLLSQRVWLYSEMLTTDAVIHGAPHLLAFHSCEHPVALQLGGSDPKALAQCARIAQEKGYDEVNLNVGCPSDRVQAGGIGACLMAQPELVAECVEAMRQACELPVTVKTRIGIDKTSAYDFLFDFVKAVDQAGVDSLTIHARKAWLQGLNPKQNRTVPPLEYEKVYRLKQDFPDLEVLINGGIKTHEAITEHLQHVDGVMLGRIAYEDPYLLATLDQRYYGLDQAEPVKSRGEIIQAYCEYAHEAILSGLCPGKVLKPLWGMSHACRGGKAWRRELQTIIESFKRPGCLLKRSDWSNKLHIS